MSRLVLVLVVPITLLLSPGVPPSPQARVPAQTPEKSTAPTEALARLPLHFVEASGGYRALWGPTEMVFGPGAVSLGITDHQRTAQRWGVQLGFPNARSVAPFGSGLADAVVSDFRGSPEDWQTGLSTYRRVAYRDLWPGVDLIYSGRTQSLKYRFVLDPGADPGRVGLHWRGAEVSRSLDGGLEISTPAGTLLDGPPLAWQPGAEGRTPVRSSWAPRPGGVWGFDLGKHDPSRPLVIDPAIVYSGFIGGSGDEDSTGDAIAVDASGAAYVTGGTFSETPTSDFPTAVGPDTGFNGDDDVWVAKIDPSGTSLVYVGFIGGQARTTPAGSRWTGRERPT